MVKQMTGDRTDKRGRQIVRISAAAVSGGADGYGVGNNDEWAGPDFRACDAAAVEREAQKPLAQIVTERAPSPHFTRTRGRNVARIHREGKLPD